MNSLPKTVSRQHRGRDLNQGPSVPESSTVTTRLLSHPMTVVQIFTRAECRYVLISVVSVSGEHYG